MLALIRMAPWILASFVVFGGVVFGRVVFGGAVYAAKVQRLAVSQPRSQSVACRAAVIVVLMGR